MSRVDSSTLYQQDFNREQRQHKMTLCVDNANWKML